MTTDETRDDILDDDQDDAGRDDTGQDDAETGDDADQDDPVALRAELDKLRAANRKLKRENARRRVADKTATATSGDGDAKTAREAEDARQDAGRWRDRAIRSEARAALAAAGASADRLPRLVRMVDTAELDIDDDGEVTGLVDQIEELKDDFPELFARAENPRRTAPRLAGGDRRQAAASTRGPLSNTTRRMLAAGRA